MTYRELYQNQSLMAKKLNKEENAIKLLIIEMAEFDSTSFYLNYDKQIPATLYHKILEAIDLYLNHNQPIQYILGYTYFYGIKLFVNKNVLIPRPETELLVEIVIENSKNYPTPKILDIGCGSGAIALALKKEISRSTITAVDISDKALDVAKENAKYNKLDINFIKSNIYENVDGVFDIIVSNPPYISDCSEVERIVFENEPHLALFASNEGLFFYQEIIKLADKYLNFNGMLAFEIPINKDKQLLELANNYYPNKESLIIKDLNNKSRILIIRNNWRKDK